MYTVKINPNAEAQFTDPKTARYFFNKEAKYIRDNLCYKDPIDATDAIFYRAERVFTAELFLLDESGKSLDYCEIENVKGVLFDLHFRNYLKKEKPVTKHYTKADFDHDVVSGFGYLLFYGVPTVLFGFFLASLSSGQREFNKEQDMKSMMVYTNANPAVPMESATSFEQYVDDGMDSTKTITIPAWTNHGGDKAACREALLYAINHIYSVKHYDHSKQKVTARIDGNTLWLFSFSFEQPVNRMYVSDDKELQQQFKDCGFHAVNLARCDAGGQTYWTVYQDNSVKDVKTKINTQKTKVSHHSTSRGSDLYDAVDDAAEERFQEILNDHGIEEADLDQY